MSSHAHVEFVAILVFLCAVPVLNTKVVLLFPKGFSISVEHQSDIREVNFDVKITNNEGNYTVASYNKNLLHSFANTWSFVKRSVALSIGDTITYKTTINRNKTNERGENGSCEVTEVPKLGAFKKHGWTFNYDIVMNCNAGIDPQPVAIQTRSWSSQEMDEVKSKLQECQNNAFNSSLSLLSMELEIEEMRNLTRQLMNFEETYPLAKQLTMSGRIPPDGDPAETVAFMIYEKLNLQPKILSAFRDSTYSISFTVSTVIEKFEILEVAKYFLANTKIVIE